ncbi:MAG: hypothetical protein GXO45_00895 [Aquificae bacterium]|nr:hypothetical protein [Aquificota bacterium]
MFFFISSKVSSTEFIHISINSFASPSDSKQEIGVSRYTLHKIEKGYLGEVSFVKVWNALRILGYDICLKTNNPFANTTVDVEDLLCEDS